MKDNEKVKIIIISGATASGKSAYAMQLAAKNNGVIINADSMQVYKELPILTAQPTLEEQSLVEHQLYSIIKCSEHFSIGIWLQLAKQSIEQVLAQGKQPIIVGGTGFYIKALQEGLVAVPEIDPLIREQIRSWGDELNNEQLHQKLMQVDSQLATRLKVNDQQRIMRGLEVFYSTNRPLSEWQQQPASSPLDNLQFYNIHVEQIRERLYENCNTRFIKMLDLGLIDEIIAFDQQYRNLSYPKVLGLKQMLAYLHQEMSLDEAIAQAQQLTRNFAKRQLTWLRHQMQFDEVYRP